MDDHIHSEIIAMAWCDKTSFDVIEQLHGVSEPQVKAFDEKEFKTLLLPTLEEKSLWKKCKTPQIENKRLNMVQKS